MFTAKKIRKRLQGEIAAAKAENPVDPKKVQELEIELRVLDADRLWKRANRWGIHNRGDLGPWETEDNSRLWFNTDVRYAEAERIVNKARGETLRKWSLVVVPIAAVIVSLVGVFFDKCG